MFKGTVRSNLDPFGEAPDNELWHALKLVHLRDAIAGEGAGMKTVRAERDGGAGRGAGKREGREALPCEGRGPPPKSPTWAEGRCRS